MRTQAAKRKSALRQSWVQMLLDLSFIGVAIFDRKSRRWMHFNDRFCALLGYTRSELARLPWTAVCHPADQAECERAFRRLTARRSRHVRMVHRILRKDGSEVRADIDLNLTRVGRPGEDWIVALVTDSSLLQPAGPVRQPDGALGDGQTAMVVLDAETGEVLDASAAAQAFYGWTLEEIKLRGIRLWDVSQTDQDQVMRRLRAAADGTIGHFDAVHRIASGEARHVEIHCGPFRLGGRRCVYGVVIDRTRNRLDEAAHRDTEEKLNAVVEQAITGIYIIEDGRFSYANPRMAEIFGYGAGELVGMQVPDLVAPADRDLVADNIRKRLSGEVGSLQYEFRGRRKDGSEIEVGVHGTIARLRGKRVIVGVVQDITERARANRESREYVRKLEMATMGAVGALSRMVDLRDPYTAGHERRVAGLSSALARELGMDDDQVRSIDIASQLHDIGKISVPAEILSKPARLSAAEFEIVKLHAANGFDILKVVEFPWPIADMARQHHERLDGSGYPQGLKNGQTLAESRIIAVADVIEAMSSHRPYRASLGIGPALAEIEQGAGLRYDPDVAAGAMRLFRDKGYRIPD